ncbi:protein LOW PHOTOSYNTHETIC EFFICIENCY 1, chloroplastic-like [Salvia miltiorrhiza]|uniref:protein LOW PHOTOSYNTHETIC EFFICIENCY 1, chloroplastic-like n=1 Tax=Salvia miltiorrhiza TaxID=226208 RepID=UPI0025AD65B9|nr:protein LOW PHOTOSYNTHETIC EFFICIENCY 1, chloroplastic-like [Salvia miltiorrhiza]
MQALTIWPSTSESWHSCVVPQLDLELISFCSLVKWGERRKRLDFCNVHGHRSLCLSRYFKGCKNGVCLAGQNYELKCKMLYLGSATASTISGFAKPKKGFLGTACDVSWALDEPTVGENCSIDELGRVDEVSGEIDRVECAHPKLDVVAEGKDYGSEFDGANNSGDDDGEKVKNVSSQRVDVRALARRLSSARTSDDVEEVLKVERILPLQVYSTVIRGFGKENNLESAMALFEWLKRKSEESGGLVRPNLFIYNSLLGAMKETRKFNFVEDVMNDMAAKGVHPSVVTYNTLMGIYTEQGKESKALQIFEEMPSKGISPSPASFSIVSFAYRRLEDGFGSLAFFVEIRDKYKGGEIGRGDDGEDWDWDHEFSKLESFTIRICYQVMRRWLVMRENRSSEVFRLLRKMDEAGLQHGRAEHERLIWACTREEHCVVAKELYTRIREVDNEMSLSVCNHLIWLLGKAKKWWAALEIYEDMLDKGPKPNNMSYELIVSHFNILLSAARKKGIWRWGVRLLNKMEEKGLKPGSREWNSVLVACSKASETSAAIEIFKRMVEQGEKPTIISYGALLSALEKGNLYEQALQVWEHMIRVGFEPNLHAYTIMASIYAGQGKFDLLDSIIKEMVAAGVDPTVITFNAIISSCGRNNHGGVGYEWFERMKLHNITPNEVTYEMLIEALARDGKPRLAYELHLRARNEGLELSAKAYDAVVQSAQLHGATVEVAALGPRPPERKKKVQIRKNLSEFCKLADVPRRSKPFVRKEIYTSKGE